MTRNQPGLIPRFLRWGTITLVGLMPFHALIYVWLGTNLGHIDWFKIWPELAIAALTPLAVMSFVRDDKLRGVLMSRKINWLILWYVALHLAIAAWRQPELKALIAGLMTNLRIVAMLLLGQIMAHQWPDRKTAETFARVVIFTGLATVVFAVLQVTILPDDFLRWFGYGSTTIRPYTKLHEGSNVLRFSSTLRGPNPFGAYLVVILSSLLNRSYRSKQRTVVLFTVALAATALLFSFSRSAWIASVIACGLAYWVHALPNARRRVGLIAAAGVVLLATGVVIFRDNNVIENAFFHTDESNVASTSDEGHLAALRAGVQGVAEDPLGDGPGTAGPASVNLTKMSPRISENYYLQLAQEVGVIGLVLFLLIFALVMQRAYAQRLYVWPQVLLVSGIGLAVANMLLHVWADDTLGIIWWAMAGYYLYLPSKAQPK